MSSGFVEASPIPVENEKQVEKVKICCKVILRFYATGNSENVHTLSAEIQTARSKPEEENNNEYKPKLLDFSIDISSKGDMKTKSRILDEEIRNLVMPENIEKAKIEFHILTDNESPFVQDIFFKYFFPKSIKNRTIGKLEYDKNCISVDYLVGISDGSNETNRNKVQEDEVPTQKEVQISALVSHYVYFYLDWIEAKWWNFVKQDGEEDEEIIKKVLGEGMPVMSTMLSGDIIGKAKYRVVNRIKEVLDIVDLMEKEEEKSEKDRPIKYNVIEDILSKCAQKGYPIDFFDFYNECRYFSYLSNIEEEAKSWHVCHPRKILRNLSKGASKETHVELIIRDSDVYYTALLDSGIGYCSGYGGALFVNDDNRHFIYVTKGTDVNSLNDWILVDLLQGISGLSLQHLHTVYNATKIDNAIREHFPKASLLFVGHSLGGGLASAGAIASQGRHAITFNAASLNFIGSLLTRVASIGSGIIKRRWKKVKDSFSPMNVSMRVHPIRIEGEIVDALQIIGKFITAGTCERGYGAYPLILDFGKESGFLKGWKHGINNFLYPSILNKLKIVEKSTKVKAKKCVLQSSSLIDVEFEEDDKAGWLYLTRDNIAKILDKN